MPWNLKKNGVTPSRPLTHAEQNNLNTFMNAVRRGTDPGTAANAWDSDYKKLMGNQYQIRLSQGCRATFIVNNNTQEVTMLQVGGHT